MAAFTTRTPPLGYAVVHFGRLTLTSHDYARYEPRCECEDSECYYLHDERQLKRLLLDHGHYAADLVSFWRYESRATGDEQCEAYQEMCEMGRYRR